MIQESHKKWIRENGIRLRFYEENHPDGEFTEDVLPATDENISKLERCCGIYEKCDSMKCRKAIVAHPLLQVREHEYIQLCNLAAGEFIGNRVMLGDLK